MISILIPVRNEEMCILPLTHEIISVMNSLKEPFEIIFINDHSTDKTESVIQTAAQEYSMVKFIYLDEEYGKDAALLGGMHEAQGEVLVTIDGDLQNDPSDIPNLVRLLDEYDMVCGVRRHRDDPVFKKMVSIIANHFRRCVSGGEISDAGCALRCMKKSCIPFIDKYNDRLFGSAHYFYPDLVACGGGRITEVPVKHRPRRFGKTKFNLMAGRVVSGIRACLAVRRIRLEL